MARTNRRIHQRAFAGRKQEDLGRVAGGKNSSDVQNPEAGRVYEVAGHKCLCVNPLASYGGGAATLWAVGHSVQLTLDGRMDGYIRGSIRIIEETSAIIFDPMDAAKPVALGDECWQV